MVGVVFPGKAFMIEKNGLQSKEQIEVQRRSRPSGRSKSKDGKKFIESQRTTDNRTKIIEAQNEQNRLYTITIKQH